MDSLPPEQPLHLTDDDPLSGLEGWLAEGRVDAAAAGRARQRWLERQAGEEATVAGVLLDLGERGQPVTVRSVGGHAARGLVVAIGADFVAIREDRVGDVLIPQGSIATVRAAPGDESTDGSRPLALVIVFAEALVELAADHPLVLVSAGGDEIRGELRSAGRDVVAILLDGQRREVMHVASGSIDHLVVVSR